MARVHWLSSNAAYGRDDPFERRLRAAESLFDDEDVRPFLAEDGGETVGVLTVGQAELYALYVHPARWGTGVGQALLDRAHAELRTTCDEASLTCVFDNVRARRLYERNGWTAGEDVIEPHFGGVPTHVVRYRRRFDHESIRKGEG